MIKHNRCPSTCHTSFPLKEIAGLGSDLMAPDQSSPRKRLSKLSHSGYDKHVSHRGTVALVFTKLTSSARHFNV